MKNALEWAVSALAMIAVFAFVALLMFCRPAFLVILLAVMAVGITWLVHETFFG